MPERIADELARRLAIGARIAEARREAGMTQRELARCVGVHLGAIARYEIGEVDAGQRLQPIAEATGRTIEWLLGESRSPRVIDVPEQDSAKQHVSPEEDRSDTEEIFVGRQADLPVVEDTAAQQDELERLRAQFDAERAQLSAGRQRLEEAAEKATQTLSALELRELELDQIAEGLDQRESELAGRERRLAEATEDVRAREAVLAQAPDPEEERERLAARQRELDGAEVRLQQAAAELAQREQALTARASEIAVREAAVAARDGAVAARDAALRAERDQVQQELATRESELGAKRKQLEDEFAALSLRQAAGLAARKQELLRLERQLADWQSKIEQSGTETASELGGA